MTCYKKYNQRNVHLLIKKEFDIEKFSPRFRFLMKGSMRRQHFTHDYTPEEHLPHAILIFSKYMFFIDYDKNCPSE